MDTVLKTVGLTKKFGSKVAVNGVDMTIKKGDIYGFIGKNGAGKTTFMRMVLGMAGVDSGVVSLFDGMELSKARYKIGSLIEQPGLYKNCSATENMKRFAILAGADEKEIPELLSLVGLGDVGRKKAGKFSLGMRQRLGIAIALLRFSGAIPPDTNWINPVLTSEILPVLNPSTPSNSDFTSPEFCIR